MKNSTKVCNGRSTAAVICCGRAVGCRGILAYFRGRAGQRVTTVWNLIVEESRYLLCSVIVSDDSVIADEAAKIDSRNVHFNFALY